MCVVADIRYLCLLLARIYTKTECFSYKQRHPLFLGGVVDKEVFSVVRPTGFEPVTLCSGGIRSNPPELRAHINKIIQNFPRLQWYFQQA